MAVVVNVWDGYPNMTILNSPLHYSSDWALFASGAIINPQTLSLSGYMLVELCLPRISPK